MALSNLIKLTGSLTAGPPTANATSPVLTKALQLMFSQTRNACVANGRSIASPAAFVDLLAGTGITTVTVFVIVISSGSLDVRLTTAGGTDAIWRSSNLVLWASPNAGDGATALAVQGTADFELIVAGDPT